MQIDPAPLESPDLSISQANMQGEHQRRIDRPRAPFLCGSQQSCLFLDGECPRYVAMHRQLERVQPTQKRRKPPFP